MLVDHHGRPAGTLHFCAVDTLALAPAFPQDRTPDARGAHCALSHPLPRMAREGTAHRIVASTVRGTSGISPAVFPYCFRNVALRGCHTARRTRAQVAASTTALGAPTSARLVASICASGLRSFFRTFATVTSIQSVPRNHKASNLSRLRRARTAQSKRLLILFLQTPRKSRREQRV